MLDVENKTSFQTALVSAVDQNGVEYAVVVIKATYEISDKRRRLVVANKQVPICYADEYYGDSSDSSIRYPSDICMRKNASDIALLGFARSDRPVESLDVILQVGKIRKTVRVFGRRRWMKFLGIWKPTHPKPFTAMSLRYESAYGGIDQSHVDPNKHAVEIRNPVGMGFFVTAQKNEDTRDLWLPHLEDPNALISGIRDRPKPAGFGFIAPSWWPRSRYVGTFDRSWQEHVCPQLPADFNDRFFNCAHPDLVYPGFLRGGELVRVENASRQKCIELKLPKEKLMITMKVKGKQSTHLPGLDTVIIEPDENRLVLVWRATIATQRCFLYICGVKIHRM